MKIEPIYHRNVRDIIKKINRYYLILYKGKNGDLSQMSQIEQNMNL